MRLIGATFLAVSLLVSSAQAAAPLPSGKPAGTKQAALLGPNLFLVLLSAGIVIGGLSLAVSNPGGSGVTTPTTSSTGTGA
jgi:hypothetical protein